MDLPDYLDRLYCTVDGYIARYYGIEQELKDSIDYTYQRLDGDGFIKDRSG